MLFYKSYTKFEIEHQFSCWAQLQVMTGADPPAISSRRRGAEAKKVSKVSALRKRRSGSLRATAQIKQAKRTLNKSKITARLYRMETCRLSWPAGEERSSIRQRAISGIQYKPGIDDLRDLRSLNVRLHQRRKRRHQKFSAAANNNSCRGLPYPAIEE